MKQTQKQREKEANEIAWKFYAWLGYRVCEDIEDELSLRKLVKSIERKAVREYKINKFDKKIILDWLDDIIVVEYRKDRKNNLTTFEIEDMIKGEK